MELTLPLLPPIPRPIARHRPQAPAHAAAAAAPPERSDLDERAAQLPVGDPNGAAAAVIAPAPDVPALCLGVARGDHESITTLYRSRFPLVYAAARRITRRDEAFGLDAAQDTFLRVLASGAVLRRIRTADDLERWLLRITYSACIDLLRKEQRRHRRERSRQVASAVDRGPAPDDQIALLRTALARLDHEDRALIRLRTEGHTLASLAHTLESTTGALHGRFRRAMQRLSQNMRESNHE